MQYNLRTCSGIRVAAKYGLDLATLIAQANSARKAKEKHMELTDFVPVICGIIGGIVGTAVYLKLKKKSGE